MDHASELLARIHADKIRPVPRWKVRVRRAGQLALFGSTLLLGTLSVALAVQSVHSHMGRGWLLRKTMNDYAPFVWAATAGLMMWAGIRIFRELPRGWRIRPWQVGAGILAFCLLGGFGLERTDALTNLHRAIAHRVPSYREAWMRKALVSWHDPAAGRISGTWIAKTDTSKVLQAVDGIRWSVRWEGEGVLPEGASIRLMGHVCGAAVFCANDWRPAPGSMNGKFHDR